MIRVAVIDWVTADRLMLQRILDSAPEISVVGSTTDGDEAVDLIFRTRPEVVTLGLHEDVAGSLRAVREIMAYHPTPILLLARPGRIEGARVADILSAGAMDVMEKPSLAEGTGTDPVFRELLLRIRLLARVPVITHVAGKLLPMIRERRANLQYEAGCRAVVAVAASTGGPVALTRLLSSLPPDIAAPLLVVQHIATGFIDGLAGYFRERCGLNVQVASSGDPVRPGIVLLGPDGGHMTVREGGVIWLDSSPSSAGVKPCADRLFQSVAQVYGARAIGVVLTGMGNDGAAGALSIKSAGGRVIVQDEATSTIFGMPGATVAAGAADEVLPLDSIAEKLVEWVGR